MVVVPFSLSDEGLWAASLLEITGLVSNLNLFNTISMAS